MWSKTSYLRNREAFISKSTEWAKRQHVRRAYIARKSHLITKYGITPEQFDKMSEDQQGSCAICGLKTTLYIDHDHATGKVRELLCWNCNVGLGHFRDSQGTLLLAAEYLKKHCEQNEPILSS